MIGSLILFVGGVFLSAFFSGSETGFYRATRVRLMLDALGGDWIARGLIWLTNNPALFVATTLIGNNVANYVTSLAIVLISEQVMPDGWQWTDVAAPIVFSPIVFVYGELLPKNLFFLAPNRLLRAGGPLFLFFTLLFLPVSALLWVLGRLLQYVVGESPEQLQLSLARKELRRVFDEGHEAGVLRPAQRRLAQSLLSLAGEHVGRYAIPSSRLPSVPHGVAKEDVYRITRRRRSPVVLVRETDGRRTMGYVRVLDLRLNENPRVTDYRSLLDISEAETPIAAMMQMQTAGELVARVVDAEGRARGFVSAAVLHDLVFRERKGSRFFFGENA